MRALSIALAFLLFAAPAAAGMLAEGATMPEWSMKDHTGAVVRSSELAGKTYLLWYYPKAQTPGCTVEARGMRDNFGALQEAGVTVLGVSFDSQQSNKEFVETESLPFRLLSDEDRKLAIAVGAAGSTWSMWASRISYLVGPDGKILKAYDDVDPGTHAGAVITDAKSVNK